MQRESEYAPTGGGGAINLVATSHPEPKRANPADDRMTREQVLRELKWNDSQFSIASCLAFPNASYRVWNSRGGSEPLWSRQEVQRWVERVRSLTIR